jgi:peptidoglycan/LPS O-acetylase OafA/YrhL
MLNGELLYRVTPFQLDSLLLGGLIALLWRGAHRELLLRLGRIGVILAFITAVAYLAISLHHSPDWRHGCIYPSWKFTWGLTFVNFFTAAVILCCLQSEGLLARILRLRPLRWLGRISYGAYVFHDLFHGLYSHIAISLGRHSVAMANHHGPVTAAIGLAFTLLISWLSFRFYESHFLNLKKRWTIRPA